MYQEYAPSMDLAQWVVCFWSSAGQGSPRFSAIHPDGCADLIFNFGGVIENSADGKVFVNGAMEFAVGTMTKALNIRVIGNVDLLGVRLKPGVMHLLSRVHQHHVTDEAVPLSELGISADTRLYETLLPLETEARIFKLQEWLLNRLGVHSSFADKKKILFLSEVLSGTWPDTVHLLSRESGFSVRQMQRLFLQYVGVSPKEYLMIRKFVMLEAMLRRPNNGSLIEVAADTGFYDHSHLTHVFRRFTGLNPSEYRSRS